MKFTVMGFSQKRLVELDLDLTDAMILRWIVDFFSTKKIRKFVVGDECFFWLDYKHLLSDLPVLSMKKDTLYRRLKKMVDAGLIEHHCERTGGGNFSCYRFVPDVYGSLVGSDQEGGGTENNPHRVRNEIRNMNPSTSESFLNPHNPPKGESCDSEKSEPKDDTQESIKAIIGCLNNLMGTNYMSKTASTQRALKARLREFTRQQLVDMVRFKVHVWKGTEFEKYITPDTLFRPSKCEKYINEMYKYVKDQQAKKKRQQPEEEDHWSKLRVETLRRERERERGQI